MARSPRRLSVATWLMITAALSTPSGTAAGGCWLGEIDCGGGEKICVSPWTPMECAINASPFVRDIHNLMNPVDELWSAVFPDEANPAALIESGRAMVVDFATEEINQAIEDAENCLAAVTGEPNCDKLGSVRACVDTALNVMPAAKATSRYARLSTVAKRRTERAENAIGIFAQASVAMCQTSGSCDSGGDDNPCGDREYELAAPPGCECQGLNIGPYTAANVCAANVVRNGEQVELEAWGCYVGYDGGSSAQCVDSTNGHTDSGGDGCVWYSTRDYQCGNYDTVRFNANSMCCSCGGGSGRRRRKQLTNSSQTLTLTKRQSNSAFVMESEGNCNGAGIQFISTLSECRAAAVSLGLADTIPHDVALVYSAASDVTGRAAPEDVPFGCYWKVANGGGFQLWFNVEGARSYNDANGGRRSICQRTVQTSAPTTPPPPPPGSTSCHDTGEALNGAVDLGGDPCSWYAYHSFACGNYDDSDFSAETMCCECGGGSEPAVEATGYGTCGMASASTLIEGAYFVRCADSITGESRFTNPATTTGAADPPRPGAIAAFVTLVILYFSIAT